MIASCPGKAAVMHSFSIEAGSGVERVEAMLIMAGQDVVAVFGGGAKHHIGASALAVARPSLAGNQRNSASCSVLCVTGHKEDELARNAALRLSARYACVVNVTVGLHIDRATPEQIKALVDNFNLCLVRAEELLAANSG